MDFIKRLYDALTQQSAMSCSTARAQIPALVVAEARGEDADRMPQFVALLIHLDCCEICMAEYLRQSAAGAA